MSVVTRGSQAAASVSPCFSAFPSLFRKRNKQIMAMVKNGVDILVRSTQTLASARSPRRDLQG